MKNIYPMACALSMATFLISCGETTTNSHQLISIDDAVKQSLSLEDIGAKVELVALETTDQSLIGKYPRVHVLGKYIAVIFNSNCLLFDRHNGSFIRKVGKKGQGPNEFNQLLFGGNINEEAETLVATKGKGIMEYSLHDGKVVTPESTVLPAYLSSAVYLAVSKDVWIEAPMNINGRLKSQLLHFNREKMIDSIPNSFKFKLEGSKSVHLFGEPFLYKYNDEAYYKNMFNDTIFRIQDNQLIPHYILYSQSSIARFRNRRNEADFMDKPEISKSIKLYGIQENDPYLFFTATKSGTTDHLFYNKIDLTLYNLEKEGFSYDSTLDISFWPSHISKKGEMSALYQADYLLEQLEGENISSDDPLYSVVNNLKPEDNPVVMIVHP